MGHLIKEFDKFVGVMQNLSNIMIKIERNPQEDNLDVSPFQPRGKQQRRSFLLNKIGVDQNLLILF